MIQIPASVRLSSLRTPHLRLSLHTSCANFGKAAKRRKMNRIENAPNLITNQRASAKTPSSLALEHFDDFYKKIFKQEWPAIRLALLSKSKFSAVLNNFSDKEEVGRELSLGGCFSLKEHYQRELQKLMTNKESSSEGNYLLGPNIPRPKPQDESDEEKADQVFLPPSQTTMSLEEAEGRLIGPEKAFLGDGNKKLAKSSSMFLHVPSVTLKGMDDFVEESEYFSAYEKVVGIPIMIKKHSYIDWPTHLDAYTFPTGNVEHFQSPRRLTHGSAFNYYCMDAASLLPVLMLDVQPGESVLDMCAGPGGKSLALMQTLRPGRLLCNDIDPDRVKRILNIMDAYLQNFNKDMEKNVIKFKNSDGRSLSDWMPGEFDRVLCDVPCYTDRHVVQFNDGNIFHVSRVKERLRLPFYQTNLLKSALMCAKPGGTVVYSTCSLSPVQNDGVVYSALKSIWEETKIEFAVSDLTEAVKPLDKVFKFAGRSNGLRYGQLVIPTIRNNFGPMYFSKIHRIN